MPKREFRKGVSQISAARDKKQAGQDQAHVVGCSRLAFFQRLAFSWETPSLQSVQSSQFSPVSSVQSVRSSQSNPCAVSRKNR